MKTINTIFLFFCLLASGFAQINFTPAVLDTTMYAQPSTYTFEAAIGLQNNTFADLQLGFENIEENMPVGWQTSNCLGANCLPIGVTSGTFSLELMSPDNYIIGHFYPNNITGSGYMRIKVYEVFNPSNFVILTYYGVVGQVTDITQIKEEDVKVFPNPAQDVLNIIVPNDTSEKIELRVFDALGRLVKSMMTTQSATQLDIADLQAGVYVVELGNVRKKIVKQ